MTVTNYYYYFGELVSRSRRPLKKLMTRPPDVGSCYPGSSKLYGGRVDF